jgi:hypothetical protein
LVTRWAGRGEKNHLGRLGNVKTSAKVPIEFMGQQFVVSPDGDIEVERPRVNSTVLDEVRLQAGTIFIVEKQRGLTKAQRDYWKRVKLISDEFIRFR